MNDTGQFTTNDAKAITLLFLNETEIFNFYKLLLDRQKDRSYTEKIEIRCDVISSELTCRCTMRWK